MISQFAAVAVEIVGQRVGDVLLVDVQRTVRRREQDVDVEERIVGGVAQRRLDVRQVGDDGRIEGGAAEAAGGVDDRVLPVDVAAGLVRPALAGETWIM